MLKTYSLLIKSLHYVVKVMENTDKRLVKKHKDFVREKVKRN